MATIKAIIIKPDTYTIQDIKPGYKTTDKLVGGDSEYVTLSPGLTLVCNATGKLDNLAKNPLATRVLRTYLNTPDYIAGTAVVYGLNGEGDSCSLTDDQIKALESILR